MATILRRPGYRAPSTEGTSEAPSPWARYANIAAGAWLFISGFIFAMSPEQRINVLVVGFLVAAFAVGALWIDGARFANTALAVWLLISTLTFLRVSGGAFINNLALSLIVFGLSLVPTPGERPTRGPTS
jgi:hypothetical protein